MNLHEFLAMHRDVILARAGHSLAERNALWLREERQVKGMPLFFEQLIGRLRKDGRLASKEPPTLETSAVQRGQDLFRAGFTVTQVVHAYGAICQATMTVAEEQRQAIEPREFGVLNMALDDAIAAAVEEFQRLTSQEASQRQSEGLGTLAHELRNALTTAGLAFGVIKKGRVAPGGSTGAIIDTCFAQMRSLIDRALTEVRLHERMPLFLESVRLAVTIEEILASLSPDAEARDVALESEVDQGVVFNADRQFLISAIANVVQNAIKYTRHGSSVMVRGHEWEGKVRIEVEDACGGLPEGKTEALFRPFSRGSTSQPGVGLGLAIARQAVEAHGGTIHARSLPGKGCVFTIELPRIAGRDDLSGKSG